MIKKPYAIVLMYHQIVPNGKSENWIPSSLADKNYGVTLKNFKNQLKAISENGFQVKSLSSWIKSFSSDSSSHTNLPTIIITFDDGYSTDFDLAFPELERLNFPSTFFISTEKIDSPGMMTFNMINKISKNPLFCLGSHGATHRFLTSLNEYECRNELLKSLSMIRDINLAAGRPYFYPIDLSAPGGRTNSAVRKIAFQLGFRSQFTSAPGILKYGEDLFSIPRLPVMSSYTVDAFIKLLNPHSFPFHLNGWVRRGRRILRNVKY